MKKAVELGIFPKSVSLAEYMINWDLLKQVLEAAINTRSAQGHNRLNLSEDEHD